MIEPQQLEALLEVMRKHGAEVLKHGDFLVQLSQFSPVVAQPEPILPSHNPFATLRDLDAAYGVPQFDKDGE